jgi:hypothetical protein
MSNQVISKHLNCLVLDLLRSLAYLHTTLETRGKLALTTTTCLDLSLKDQATLVAESSSDFLCFFSCLSETAFLNIDAIFAHDVL